VLEKLAKVKVKQQQNYSFFLLVIVVVVASSIDTIASLIRQKVTQNINKY
jgi:hypothetical protein